MSVKGCQSPLVIEFRPSCSSINLTFTLSTIKATELTLEIKYALLKVSTMLSLENVNIFKGKNHFLLSDNSDIYQLAYYLEEKQRRST